MMIVCLRPQPDCDLDVAELKTRGVVAVALPMLTINYRQESLDQLRRSDFSLAYRGVIITSKQVSRYLAKHAKELADLMRLPFWCVGPGSAEILRAAGFTVAFEGSGGATELANEISRRMSAPRRRFLWLSGRDVHLDLGITLADFGIAVDRLIVYHSDVVNMPNKTVQDGFKRGESVAALAFSARSLAQFQIWLDERISGIRLSDITIFAASAALAEQAHKAGFTTQQAARPTRDAFFELCQAWTKQHAG